MSERARRRYGIVKLSKILQHQVVSYCPIEHEQWKRQIGEISVPFIFFANRPAKGAREKGYNETEIPTQTPPRVIM